MWMAEYVQSAQAMLSKRRLTVCVVGSGGVGKSSLTVRYLQGHFPEVGGVDQNIVDSLRVSRTW